MILHITNGDSAAIMIGLVFPHDRVIPWRDILHEGPVPAGLDISELSEVRATYLASEGYAEFDAARASFVARNAALRLSDEFAETVLWFEPDLYDQLQLIQILDWFRESAPDANMSLIQAGAYLGSLNEAEISGLWPERQAATRMQFDGAHMAWEAFRSPHPTLLGAMARNRYVDLPYLGPALTRMCEEYPAENGGLSKVERLVLEAVAQGISEPVELYQAYSEKEEWIFLGDGPFFRILDGLNSCPQPLLDPEFRLTRKGEDVLAGNDDRIDGNGIDRWIGGVHLHGPDSPWRFDPARRQFRPRVLR